MRANVDAVVVGVGTVLADDPRLTVRDYPEPRRQPVRVVFDSSLRTPVSAAVVQTARETPTIIVSRAPEPMRRRALESHGVQVMEAGTIRTALGKLKEQGIRSILLEGGPTLAQAFLKEKLVDRIALFEAPIELGPAAPQAFTRERRRSLESLKVVRTADFGPDRLTVRAL